MAEEIESQEQGKKKGGKLKWIIILVLILAIAGAAFFFKDKIMGMLGMGGDPAEEQTTQQPADAPGPLEPGVQGPMVSIAPFVANLQDPLGKRYIKLGIEVELRDEKAVEVFDLSNIKIKDMLIRLLGGKRPQDMLGQQNQLELKQEIVNRLNQILGPGQVINIYFSDFILQ